MRTVSGADIGAISGFKSIGKLAVENAVENTTYPYHALHSVVNITINIFSHFQRCKMVHHTSKRTNLGLIEALSNQNGPLLYVIKTKEGFGILNYRQRHKTVILGPKWLPRGTPDLTLNLSSQ